MSASQLYGPGTPVTNARGTVVGFNGAGTDEFTQRNPFWEVGLLGTIPKLPGEGSMEFSDMFGYMDSPSQRNPIPLSNNDNGLGVMRLLMDGINFAPTFQLNSNLLNSSLMPRQSFNPRSSFNSPDLNLMSGVMDRVNPQIPFNSSLLDSPLMPRQPFIPRPSSHDNGLALMRGMMNGLQFVIPPSNNDNGLAMMRGLMDSRPMFSGIDSLEFMRSLMDGPYRHVRNPIDLFLNHFYSPTQRVANNFMPLNQSPTQSFLNPLIDFNNRFNQSFLTSG